MMSSRIPLLECFSTCTMVMPYFGPTHKSFLLLSQLSKGSRKMLDEFFEEILNCLKENLVCLTIEYDFQIELMFLPANLFKFSICLNTTQALESFVKLIERINNKKGYYFNENYMHNRLCIEKMYVYSNILSLKEEDIEFSQNIKSLFEKSSCLSNCLLVNHDSIKISSDSTRYIFPHYIDREVGKGATNPLFDSFKNMAFLNLCQFDIKSAIEVLTNIRDLELKIHRISLQLNSSFDSEQLTNPTFFKKGVGLINYYFKNMHYLTDEIINNIYLICPETIRFCMCYGMVDDYDYIRVLQNIKSCSNLEFIKTFKNSCCLTFTNALILIKSNNHDPFFVKCNKFSCSIHINEINQKYSFLKVKSNDARNKSLKFLKLNNSDTIKIHNYSNVTNDKEIKQLQNQYSELLSECENKCEFVIPMKCLDSVDFCENQSTEIINSEYKIDFIKEVCITQKICCRLDFSKCLLDLDQYISLFTEKCTFYLENSYAFEYKIGKPFYDNYPNIIKQLDSMKFSNIGISTMLTNGEVKLIKEVITQPNSKIYLKSVSLNYYDFEDAFEVLRCLSFCQNIESINIKYRNDPISLDDDPKEIIKELKNKIFKRSDSIKEILFVSECNTE